MPLTDTIDEEVRTTNNQLDLYEERRGPGYSDDELVSGAPLAGMEPFETTPGARTRLPEH